MTEIPVAGNVYQVGRMPPMKQFHVSRRLAPLAFAFGAGLISNESISGALSKGAPVPEAAPEGDTPPAEDDMLKDVAGKDLLTAFEPVTMVLAGMKDEDVEYVFKTCLGYVKRQQGNAGWAAIQAGNGALMFDDIDMNVMMQLTIAVIKENKLANFLTAQL